MNRVITGLTGKKTDPMRKDRLMPISCRASRARFETPCVGVLAIGVVLRWADMVKNARANSQAISQPRHVNVTTNIYLHVTRYIIFLVIVL
jgi:hypothetical protein